MKNFKKVLGVLVAGIALVALASCGGDASSSTVSGDTTSSTVTGRQLSDYKAKSFGTVGESTFKDVFTENWGSLNYLTSSRQQDNDFFANFVDGLVETDRFGAFVPALEASHEAKDANADGTQDWEFTLKDAVWTDSKGTPTAFVTADDFVTAAQYILTPTNGSGTTALWFTFIDGAEDWYNARFVMDNYNTAKAIEEDGVVTSTVEEVKAQLLKDAGFETYDEATAIVARGFDDVVGIHAVDGKVVYTVNGVKPYFYSVLSYSSFLPLRAEYILSKGQDFGKNADNIEYCGAYLMKSFTASASAELTANPYYWDAGSVNTTTVKLIFNNLLQKQDTRSLYEAGSISGFAVQPKDEAGWAKYVTGGDDGTGTVNDPAYAGAYSGKGKATSVYASYFNFNRGAVESSNEKFGNWSSHTEESYANTKAALQNADFRLMFTYGIDFVQYTTDFYGKAYEYQNRGWSPSGWLTADSGKDYTYYFAKEFVEQNPYASDDLTVDEAAKQLYNEADANIVYSKESMQAEALKAYNALKDTVTFPVKIEVSGSSSAEDNAVIIQFFGDTENGLDNNLYAMVNGEKVDLVDISIVEVSSSEQEEDIFYGGYCDYNRFTGWGPDYADPLTFLNCFVDGGDVTDNYGVQDDALSALLANYTALVEAADAIQDIDARYEAFAKAEYDLIFGEGLLIPFLSASSTNAYVSKVLPYSSNRASSGLGDSKYKNKVVGSKEITKDQFAALKVAFQTGDSDTLEAAIEKVLSEQ